MRVIAVMAMLFLTLPTANEVIEIKIALYYSISPSVKLIERAFHYAW